MLENEMKRIADALEVIALSLQPTDVTGRPSAVEPPPPSLVNDDPVLPPATPKKRKATAPVTAPVTAEPDPLAEVLPASKMTTDEIVMLVQKAVKINRDATLEVCKKYGYIRTLKEISEDKYPALAKELETVK